MTLTFQDFLNHSRAITSGRISVLQFWPLNLNSVPNFRKIVLLLFENHKWASQLNEQTNTQTNATDKLDRS